MDTYEMMTHHRDHERSTSDIQMHVKQQRANIQQYIAFINRKKTHKNIYVNKRLNNGKTSNPWRDQMIKNKSVG